jgi:hypothetical protein
MSFSVHLPCSETTEKWERKEEMKIEHKIQSENLKGRDNVEDLDVAQDFYGVCWIQARHQWQILVNVIRKVA